jgi:hypothetical protein
MDRSFLKGKSSIEDINPSSRTDFAKSTLIILVLAGSVYFFRVKFLSKDLIYIAQFVVIGLMGAVILFQAIYWKYELYRRYFNSPLFLIFLGVLLSMITAYAFHSQSFVISFWAQRFMYFYLFYFVLHIIQVPVQKLEKILFYAGVIYALLFIVQYLAFPKVLFTVRQGVERGTVRIFIPGMAFMHLAYFMGFTRLIFFNSFKYIPYLLLFMGIYILTGTRSTIAAPTIITILILIFSNKIRSKGVILLLILLLLGAAYYMFQDIIENLITLSVEQKETAEENIRVRATRFFLTDFFPNNFAYITGNGEGHQASPFGKEIFSYKILYGYYQSDIGLIGEYVKFGVFFLAGAFMILYKGIFQPVDIHHKYVRYFFLLLLVSMPLSANFTSPDSIVVICIMAYILDYLKNNKKEKEKEKKPLVYFPELESVRQTYIK